MTLTLSQMYQTATQPLKKGVIDIFRKDSLIMDKLPWETTGTLSIDYVRTKTMPTITARNIGEAFTESTIQMEPMNEEVCLLGTYSDVPKELAEAKNNLVNVRSEFTKQATRALKSKFNDMFINSDPTNDPKDMVGIHYRLTNDLASAQRIDGSSVDISSDATLSTTGKLFETKLYEAMYACEEHSCDLIVTGSGGYLALRRALANSGMLATSKDAYGRSFPTFGEGGPIIWDIGTKADQSTQIIGAVENANGETLTGSVCTTYYCLKFGEGFLKGFQMKDITVDDKGLLESGVAYRTIIDWAVGVYFANPRSMSKLYGVTVT